MAWWCVLPVTSEKLSINSHRDRSNPSAISGDGITQCVSVGVSVKNLTTRQIL